MTTVKLNESWSQVLLDKVVFITGAGGGIGSAISHTCALHGARVVVSDINKAAADKVVTDILGNQNEASDRIMSLELDTVDEQAIEQAVKKVVDKWGTIHVLVNAAADFTLGLIENVSADAWSHIFNVNVRGYALMIKHIVPLLKQQRSGSIIQFGSISGLIAQAGFVPYNTTKAAVIQMTRNIALDLGPYNIRCNSISPGCIGTPQEIANMVVFLASDLCPFITGANLTADGGYTTI
ncbi:unnamed protein product [Rotaria sp. Silwood1]|nr:unnamed protein product [Rotaria sp. Silwood1]CAF1057576.1 unnamed protein product [Rotaria sp. Silwood1]CAF3416313.1 unnamed protein product [Rotaria sp. Silwood1]CAF4621797.1 unnamed protein product [Rotaria sp. Silwood1]